jgi:hypothetical protein
MGIEQKYALQAKHHRSLLVDGDSIDLEIRVHEVRRISNSVAACRRPHTSGLFPDVITACPAPTSAQSAIHIVS